MTERERAWASIGYEYAEGIDRMGCIVRPDGREIRRNADGGWETQPAADNYWCAFADAMTAAWWARRSCEGGPVCPSECAEMLRDAISIIADGRIVGFRLGDGGQVPAHKLTGDARHENVGQRTG